VRRNGFVLIERAEEQIGIARRKRVVTDLPSCIFGGGDLERRGILVKIKDVRTL